LTQPPLLSNALESNRNQGHTGHLPLLAPIGDVASTRSPALFDGVGGVLVLQSEKLSGVVTGRMIFISGFSEVDWSSKIVTGCACMEIRIWVW